VRHSVLTHCGGRRRSKRKTNVNDHLSLQQGNARLRTMIVKMLASRIYRIASTAMRGRRAAMRGRRAAMRSRRARPKDLVCLFLFIDITPQPLSNFYNLSRARWNCHGHTYKNTIHKLYIHTYVRTRLKHCENKMYAGASFTPGRWDPNA